MRTFIVADISHEVREKAKLFIDESSSFQSRGIKFVEAGNLHITIKFIGETDPSRIEDIKTALQKISFDPFMLSIKGAGWFPTKGSNPRVLWLGIERNEYLIRLFDAVDRRLSSTGVPRDTNPYSPHLTIARLKTDVEKQLYNFVASSAEKDFGSFVLDRFFLYKSELTAKGPVYSKLAEFLCK